jgi:hypothetical protein
MGLKGYRLWVMGQLDSTCRAPPRASSGVRVRRRLARHFASQLPERRVRVQVQHGDGLQPERVRDVAAQVEFGSQILKASKLCETRISRLRFKG